jgi:uncharacterized protein (TIGR02246 family)
MSTASTPSDDERALRQLIYRYARCADTRDGDGFATVFTDDGELQSFGQTFAGPEALSKIPGMLSNFVKTYHTVLNCLFTLNGDSASGEIYSTAHHLKPTEEGEHSDYVMYITYRDSYRRTSQGWRIARRIVDIEFTENRTVTMGTGG